MLKASTFPPSPPRYTEWPFLALAIVLSILSFALLWYQAYGMNQAIQLAYVNHWIDPTLYPRDPFIATSDYYTTLLWKTVAGLAGIAPLRPMLMSFLLGERWLAIYAASRIARSLAGGSALARVAAMAIMTVGPLPLLGAGTTMPDYFEQSGLAMAVLLLGIACFLDRQYLWWGALAGLSVNLNALYVAFSVVYCAAIFFAERRAWREIRYVCLAAILMAVLSLPLLNDLYHLPSHGSFDHRLWWQAMQFRSAHHLMPLTWSPIRYAEYAVTIVLLLVIGWMGRTDPTVVKLSRFAVAVAIVSVTAVAGAFFVAYAVHIPKLLILQPIRATDLGYCLTDVAFACFAAKWFERKKSTAVFPLLLLSCLWPLLPFAALVIAMVCGVAVYLMLNWMSGARIRNATLACLASLTVAAVARPALAWKYTMFNTGNRWPVSTAAEWAARVTPRDALFLLDADDDRTEPFRALSCRSVFVHVKDGTALFYDMDYLQTWQQRMALAGYPLPNQKSIAAGYPQWRDRDALALHAKAGVNFWLVTREWPTALPVVWQDKTFKVVSLDGPIHRLQP